MLITIGCLFPTYRSLAVEQHIAVTSPERLLRQVIGQVLDIGLRQYGSSVSKEAHL